MRLSKRLTALVFWTFLTSVELKDKPRINLQVIQSARDDDVVVTSRNRPSFGRYGQGVPDQPQPPAPPPFEDGDYDQDIHPPAPPPESLTTLRPPPRGEGYHYGGVRGPSTDRREPQPPAPPPEDGYSKQATPPDVYPTLESDRRPTSTELSKIIELLENNEVQGPARSGKFYDYHVVKSVPVPAAVPVPVIPVRIRPLYAPAPADPPLLRVDVTDISCYQTPSRSQFRAVLVPSRPLAAPPVFEHRAPGARCRAAPQDAGEGRKYLVDMNGADLDECGAQLCPDNGETRLCLAVRFPTVRGLKLPEDLLMSIQCRTQDRVIEQSRTLRINTAAGRLEGRAVPLVAVGGLRYEFQSQMALYRRPSGGSAFTQRMTPGGSVQLGEELQLRCDIRSGDGWQYSRLGDVTVHRATHDGLQTQDSIVLVNADGCRNPLMKSVCPHHPRRDSLNPLSTTVNWRVFMFQEMKEGEEMIVSTRLIGCLEEGDCHPECYGFDHQGQHRTRRDVTSANRTADWTTDLSFRVVLRKAASPSEESIEWVLPALSMLLALLCCALLVVALYIYKTFLQGPANKTETQEYLNIKWPARFEID